MRTGDNKLGSVDVEIGAVEIKNGTDDTRATVIADDSTMPATPPFMPSGGEYRASQTTYADGDATVDQADALGNKRITSATLIAGEDLTADRLKVEQRFSSSYISSATTTTIKSGSGFLHTITVNGGTAGTVIVYDNTAASGTIIASFDSTNALATYTFDVSFATGLTIITAAATKITTSYR